MKWLMGFLVECYGAAPAHLNAQIPQRCDLLLVHLLEIEADELWSFIGKKANPQWRWLALDAQSRQVLAFHVGDRSRNSARRLWNQLPAVYRKHATFHTDAYPAYGRVIPKAQHRPVTKAARKTNSVERFNGTLRQRLSRLVRSTLSFSKKLTNHIGAIRYFICHYNLTRATRCRANPFQAEHYMEHTTRRRGVLAWGLREVAASGQARPGAHPCWVPAAGGQTALSIAFYAVGMLERAY